MAEKRGITRADVVEILSKKFGSEIVVPMDGSRVSKVAVVPTGSLRLDKALGIGGWPRGRIVEGYGGESSGKTTLTLHAIAEVQRSGGVCGFVDAEHALDPKYATALGVDVKGLLISQPDCGEQALEVVDSMIQSGGVDMVVVDSVAALTPKAELEGEMGDAHMGLQARLMSQALRKITGSAYRTNTLVFFINQTRQKIGVVYGSPTTTTGGNALKFYASVRVEVKRIGTAKEGEDAVGSKTVVKVVKNKCAPPFNEAEFQITWGKGIAREAELLDLACEHGLAEKKGTWFSVGGERIGQGLAASAEALAAAPKRLAELEKKVRQAVLG